MLFKIQSLLKSVHDINKMFDFVKTIFFYFYLKNMWMDRHIKRKTNRY